MMKNRIKELRKDRDLTQEDLAEKCDTSKQTIQRLESGQRQLNNKWIERISEALGVGPNELFAEVSEQESDFLNVIRKMTPDQRRIYLNMGAAFLKEEEKEGTGDPDDSFTENNDDKKDWKIL